MYLGGNETTNHDLREVNSIRARCIASKMLGKFYIAIKKKKQLHSFFNHGFIGLLSLYIVQLPPEAVQNNQEVESPINCYVKVILSHLNTKSALQRLVCGLVICEWAKLQAEPVAPKDLVDR